MHTLDNNGGKPIITHNGCSLWVHADKYTSYLGASESEWKDLDRQLMMKYGVRVGVCNY